MKNLSIHAFYKNTNKLLAHLLVYGSHCTLNVSVFIGLDNASILVTSVVVVRPFNTNAYRNRG